VVSLAGRHNCFLSTETYSEILHDDKNDFGFQTRHYVLFFNLFVILLRWQTVFNCYCFNSSFAQSALGWLLCSWIRSYNLASWPHQKIGTSDDVVAWNSAENRLSFSSAVGSRQQKFRSTMSFDRIRFDIRHSCLLIVISVLMWVQINTNKLYRCVSLNITMFINNFSVDACVVRVRFYRGRIVKLSRKLD